MNRCLRVESLWDAGTRPVRCCDSAAATHLEVQAHFPLDMLTVQQIRAATFSVEVQHRGHELPDEFRYPTELRGLPKREPDVVTPS